ncbi:MAG: TIGR03089 family protein [Corynebacterium sp.]|nr:TIGR03089 family protein [Corynebacterium sp.]
MDLLAKILALDPTTPRLTVYNEQTGARLDFSGITLDNWTAKVANMLLEELDLDEDSLIGIHLQPGWQAVTIALGALAADVGISLTSLDSLIESRSSPETDETDKADEADVLFLPPEAFTDAPCTDSTADIVIVTDDPFGRGVVETGGELPEGAIDFGPTVRFYGDNFFPQTRELAAFLEEPNPFTPDSRVLIQGWSDWEDFSRKVLAPLAAGGSVVIVSHADSPERLEQIDVTEKVTQQLLL